MRKKSVTLRWHIVCRSPIWACGRDADIVKSVYFTLILDLQESHKFYITVKNVATVDVSGMKIKRLFFITSFWHIIQREASALLFFCDGQCESLCR